jgi:hypothetical protein
MHLAASSKHLSMVIAIFGLSVVVAMFGLSRLEWTRQCPHGPLHWDQQI